VLAVDEAGNDEATEPTQLTLRLDREHGRLELIGLAFGGSICTSRVEPTVKSPASFVMNGFQSG
jgi:hypothetical protein